MTLIEAIGPSSVNWSSIVSRHLVLVAFSSLLFHNPIIVSTRPLKAQKAREILIMSNRFVSAGTIGSSGELSKDTGAAAAPTEQPLYDSAKNKEWETVQKELDAERRRREEQRVKAATGEGEQSLYDILQANKGKPTPH